MGGANTPNPPPGRGAVTAGLRYAGFGMEFAGIIVAGVMLGFYADDYLGTSPWLMLLLTIGGMVGAVRRLLWSLKKHSGRD